MENTEAANLPSAFIWRRIHSLAGIWISIYLIMHLLTNSQASLLIGNDGAGFIHSVNSIHQLPYLILIEVLIVAIPILIHTIWGINYALKAKYNSFYRNEKESYLPYSRNKAYTWQRITSWFLAIALSFHIIHMRFIEYPTSASNNQYETNFMVRVNEDPGLNSLSKRLHVQLYDLEQIKNLKNSDYSEKWLEAIQKRTLSNDQFIAVAKDFGTAELLMVRETFKNIPMMIFYTLFVLAAAFHGFNGLWTFLITWGISPVAVQKKTLRFSQAMMVLVALMGLSTIWLTYWVNLKS
ncbi:MAG: hypothetical protein BGO10_10580 [Chlamydia sp. 32-24]|nr:MAG: hypothetical protein BGO10_10580 [Chlamydia sp. 32-24]